jgi:Holliday junction resolvasome RuvABC endonuclease subunit
LLAILQAECEAKELPYSGIPVGTIKKRATGKGNASKEEMVAAAKLKWPGEIIVDDNQADALWILEAGRLILPR